MIRGLVCLLALLTLSVSVVLADGKVYPRGVAVAPPIPDQQAIIAWDEVHSTETLAIETRFAAVSPGPASTADGKTTGDAPYAWVVPLPGPAAPQISAATSGLFPTVRAIFQPRVYDNGADWLGVLLFLTAMLLLAVGVSSRGRGSNLSSLVSILLVLLGFSSVAGLLLPTLGSARSSAGGASPGVQVLSRTIIGSYDITVVGAEASGAGVAADKALAAWFNSNGFELPAVVGPVLADYAARSWVFAAVKLRPDSSAGRAAYLSPHPLIFRFKTAVPIYPMRLTGVGNGPLALDLYIFGQSRASVPGLSEVRCDRCQFGEIVNSASSRMYSRGVIGIGHPVLTEIVGKLPVATKLSGTLSPAMQLADMHVAWSEFRQSGEVAYGPRSARWRSIEAGFVVVPIALVLLIVVGAVWNQEPRLVFRWLRWAIVPAIAVGVVTWCLIPKVEVQDPARSSYRLERDLEQLPDLVHDSLLSRSGAATVDDVRAAARAAIDLHGLQTQEEDSPHGYAVRPGADGRAVEFVLYNWCGTPMVRQVWP